MFSPLIGFPLEIGILWRAWASVLRLHGRCRALAGLGDGQCERKDRAVAKLAGDADTSLVGRDDGLGDRQSHSSAAHEVALIFAAVKLVENHGLFEVVDARAAIGNAGGDGVAGLFSSDGDR